MIDLDFRIYNTFQGNKRNKKGKLSPIFKLDFKGVINSF